METAESKIESKVPALTLMFWIIKIAATTLGETAGDAVSISMNIGYVYASLIFTVFFVACVGLQISRRKFHPAIYWTTIITTTTLGTTLADLADRSLGLGYSGGSSLLAALLILSLAAWKWVDGSIAVSHVRSTRTEAFYWLTIMFSQTLGTALGDWTADTQGLGYLGGVGVFVALLLLIAVLYMATRISRTALFWLAFVLTRPLGAVVGDFLDKPTNEGGLALSRYSASAALLAFIVIAVYFSESRRRKPMAARQK